MKEPNLSSEIQLKLLTMYFAGEKRAVIAKKLGLCTDTVTDYLIYHDFQVDFQGVETWWERKCNEWDAAREKLLKGRTA